MAVFKNREAIPSWQVIYRCKKIEASRIPVVAALIKRYDKVHAKNGIDNFIMGSISNTNNSYNFDYNHHSSENNFDDLGIYSSKKKRLYYWV